MTLTETIKSPCIMVCAVDGETGLCLGCGRTLAEIGNWTRLTAAARDEVMALLPARIDRLVSLGKR
ncbi:MAG: DUF1289 domain-containing protein [Hyphomonas sp.]